MVCRFGLLAARHRPWKQRGPSLLGATGRLVAAGKSWGSQLPPRFAAPLDLGSAAVWARCPMWGCAVAAPGVNAGRAPLFIIGSCIALPSRRPHKVRVCPVCHCGFRPSRKLSAEKAARQLCCSHQCATTRQHAKRRAAIRDPKPPTPQQIARRAAEIRAVWDEQEKRQRLRADWQPQPWQLPIFAVVPSPIFDEYVDCETASRRLD
jgi:hypothetical protein